MWSYKSIPWSKSPYHLLYELDTCFMNGRSCQKWVIFQLKHFNRDLVHTPTMKRKRIILFSTDPQMWSHHPGRQILGAIQKGRHRQIGSFWPSLPPLSPFVTNLVHLPPSLVTGQIVTNFFSVDMMLKRDLRSHNGVIEVYWILRK